MIGNLRESAGGYLDREAVHMFDLGRQRHDRRSNVDKVREGVRRFAARPHALRTDAVRAGDLFQVAALFLSASGMSEADRSAGGGEPIRIGIQRDAAYRVAIRHQIGVVKEFVEVGAPATSLRRRPALRRLLDYLKNHPDIRYVIFSGENRFAHTDSHARLLHGHFKRLNVRVVIIAKKVMGAGGPFVSQEVWT